MSTSEPRIVQALGDAAKRSGVLTEVAGKIFAVLYLNPGHLSLDEITEAIGTSKGNASVQVRELLDIGMVRKVRLPQSRRDYYEANTDLWSIATAVVGRRIEDEARSLLTALDGVDVAANLAQDRAARINSMRVFLQMAIAMVGAFRRGEIMNTQALQKVGG